MLNLMVGLNGYTLCSGIVCRELNGTSFVTIPFEYSDPADADEMVIGCITKKNVILSRMGETYMADFVLAAMQEL